MKIIHTADLHFDSKMETHLTSEQARERKLEIRLSFKRLVDYARENGVDVVLICGDMFDSANVLTSTKNFILDTIRENAGIDFLLLKGNHDEFMFNRDECPQNLKLFENDFTYFNYGEVCIAGMNLNRTYLPNNFDLLRFNPNQLNILCLHGQVANAFSSNVDYCVPLNALANKGIDYVALGHIHNFASGFIDNRAVYAYSGILEPRGFDECGEKGFIEIDVANGRLNYKFIPFSKRQFHSDEVNISNAETTNEVISLIGDVVRQFKSGDFVRVILCGDRKAGLDMDLHYIEKFLKEQFYFAMVVDATVAQIDYAKLSTDISLKGEFIRTVLAESGLSDMEKQKIIDLGIKALTRGEV